MHEIDEKVEEVATQVVGAVYQVHRILGPGLLESTYEVCLAHELKKRGVHGVRQVDLPVVYDDVRLEAGYRIDMLVAGCVLLELKAVDKLLSIHEAQLLTYLKLSGHKLGFLINFNVRLIKDGIKRRVLT
jgi:GxxExxY protein